MSTPHGNKRWRALSDTHNAKGQLLGPDPCDGCQAHEIAPKLRAAGIAVTCENLRAAWEGGQR